MPMSSVLTHARELSAAGHYSGVVEYLSPRTEELEESPILALLYGTAQGRIGRHDEGSRWLDVALNRARQHNEPSVERHALNARGAMALVSGRIDDAADSFTQALMAASRDGDAATTGRCSNNLGIISNLRGRHAEAIGSWQIALAAFETARLSQGIAECHHNLALSHREQGQLDRALAEADRAAAVAEGSCNGTLWALTLRGRAEIRIARNELEAARAELDRVRTIRIKFPHAVDEAEDLRVEAGLARAQGDLAAAERMLRTVIERAGEYQVPQLVAEATRDLSMVLREAGRNAEARAAAREATVVFTQLGAEAEIRNLASQRWDDDFSAELSRSLEPLHAAQELADAGKYTELVQYLGARSNDELEHSPMLALLFGIGQSRLGRLELGQQWARVALSRARLVGDRKLEVRGLNVCGAIALERGGLPEATYFFTQAQDDAMRDSDMAALGRCANNLGIIANMRGDYGRAVGAYTRAIAAYQQAHYDRGIVESEHNLGITYRDMARLDDALQAADRAAAGAQRLGDRRLAAQALAGRAEILIARGQPKLAAREARAALAVHRELQAPILETEDMRILAVAIGMTGKTQESEAMLRDVIERGTKGGWPVLVAAAQRDLAHLFALQGDAAAASEMARAAQAAFEQLGVAAEVEKLVAFVGPRRRDPAGDVAAPPIPPGPLAPSARAGEELRS